MDRILHSMTHQSLVKSRRPITNPTVGNKVPSATNAHEAPSYTLRDPWFTATETRRLLRNTEHISVSAQPKLARMRQTA